METLQDYLFHYNPYQGIWFAFNREHYLEYFNGNYENTTKHKNIKTLAAYVSTFG